VDNFKEAATKNAISLFLMSSNT